MARVIEIHSGIREGMNRLKLKSVFEQFGTVVHAHKPPYSGNAEIDMCTIRMGDDKSAEVAVEALKAGRVILDGSVLGGDFKGTSRGAVPNYYGNSNSSFQQYSIGDGKGKGKGGGKGGKDRDRDRDRGRARSPSPPPRQRRERSTDYTTAGAAFGRRSSAQNAPRMPKHLRSGPSPERGGPPRRSKSRSRGRKRRSPSKSATPSESEEEIPPGCRPNEPVMVKNPLYRWRAAVRS